MGLKRNVDSTLMEGGEVIENIEYNSYSGCQKNMEVGPSLEFVSVTTAEVGIAAGSQLFLFNTAAAIGYVEMSKTTGIGVVGTAPAANTFPVLPESYTKISAADYKFIKGSATIYLYVLRDDSIVRINP